MAILLLVIEVLFRQRHQVFLRVVEVCPILLLLRLFGLSPPSVSVANIRLIAAVSAQRARPVLLSSPLLFPLLEPSRLVGSRQFGPSQRGTRHPLFLASSIHFHGH